MDLFEVFYKIKERVFNCFRFTPPLGVGGLKSLKMNWLQNILPDNLQYALGWTVVHSIWQGIVIASIMAIILMSVKNLSANARYWIANGSLLLMLVSSAGTFAWLSRSIAAEQNGLLTLSQNADLLRGGNDLSQYVDNQGFIYNILSFFNEHIL